jgi:hypothetical protein
MKKLTASMMLAALLAGCGSPIIAPPASLTGMASFEALGTDDVGALASKATMRKQTKAALEVDTQEMIAFADRAPKDGKLSLAELQAKLPGFSRAVFRSKDADHDGLLALDELVTDAIAGVMTERLIRIRSGCVKALSKDRDRQLTRDDLLAAKQFHFDPQPWSPYAKLELEDVRVKLLKEAFASKAVDANQDGKLDYDELFAFFLFAVERGAMPLTLAKPQSPLS